MIGRVVEEYAKHAALNLGQAAHELRYVHSHPDADAEAARGTLRHLGKSLRMRTSRVANDVFFAVIPPHWHHTTEELAGMAAVPLRKWFFYGYCQWRFEEDGTERARLDGIDRRWDSRCKAESPVMRHGG